uniref:Putative Proline rich extensin signature n=1 Tax=Davidia involucrata TaxID=16924 RepID=A0A5B6YRT5_DAVIN
MPPTAHRAFKPVHRQTTSPSPSPPHNIIETHCRLHHTPRTNPYNNQTHCMPASTDDHKQCFTAPTTASSHHHTSSSTESQRSITISTTENLNLQPDTPPRQPHKPPATTSETVAATTIYPFHHDL